MSIVTVTYGHFIPNAHAHGLLLIMATSHEDLLDIILNPDESHADALLSELGLDEIPPPEQIHRDIEQKLLLPPR